MKKIGNVYQFKDEERERLCETLRVYGYTFGQIGVDRYDIFGDTEERRGQVGTLERGRISTCNYDALDTLLTKFSLGREE